MGLELGVGPTPGKELEGGTRSLHLRDVTQGRGWSQEKRPAVPTAWLCIFRHHPRPEPSEGKALPEYVSQQHPQRFVLGSGLSPPP